MAVSKCLVWFASFGVGVTQRSGLVPGLVPGACRTRAASAGLWELWALGLDGLSRFAKAQCWLVGIGHF